MNININEDISISKSFYTPICSEDEINRIFNVKNAKDYLLKLRADTIVDHMRLFRVYRNKANSFSGKWSLEASFKQNHYLNFLTTIPSEYKHKCSSVVFGNIFSNEPNGHIFKTGFGPVITISESLTYFSEFMNLALLDFNKRVPDEIRLNSLRIAIRVMLKTEALDFFMDPRGIIPTDIKHRITQPTQYQMQFIAGHEFSHHILDHLSESNIVERFIFHPISDKDGFYKPMKVYNQSQKDEFAADISALTLPKLNPKEFNKLFEASLLWFGSLEIFEAVCDTLYPRSPWAYKTHPTAKDRFYNIIDNVKKPSGFNIKKWETFWDIVEKYKHIIIEDISLNCDFYEMYGSAYLDEPNSKWRGKRLIDRVDYY